MSKRDSIAISDLDELFFQWESNAHDAKGLIESYEDEDLKCLKEHELGIIISMIDELKRELKYLADYE